jgi:predicted alpha/beta-fold hydrolase
MTIWPAIGRGRIPLTTRSERFELPDGDFVDLAWIGDPDPKAPVTAIFHGLEGSIDSSYVRGIGRAIAARGWRAVLMHFRGCSGEPNRLPRGYHAGDTADVRGVSFGVEAPLSGSAPRRGGLLPGRERAAQVPR